MWEVNRGSLWKIRSVWIFVSMVLLDEKPSIPMRVSMQAKRGLECGAMSIGKGWGSGFTGRHRRLVGLCLGSGLRCPGALAEWPFARPCLLDRNRDGVYVEHPIQVEAAEDL